MAIHFLVLELVKEQEKLDKSWWTKYLGRLVKEGELWIVGGLERVGKQGE